MKTVMQFLRFSIVSSFLVLTASASKFRGRRKQIAVLITGIEDSFVWANALDMVISPVTQQGYNVHFYISLVARGKQNDGGFLHVAGEGDSPVDLDDWIKNTTAGDSSVAFSKSGTISQVNISSWKEAIARTPGAQIKFLELLDRKEHVDIPANAPIKISSYPPQKRRCGRNLLRKFHSTENLMHMVMDEERADKFRYDFVMTTRDDATWLSPLSMRTFEKAASQNTIFSRNCLAYDGLNDKVFVFGREAAEKCLIGLYSDFWTNGIGAFNAETYWMQLAESKGVHSVTVAPTELPLSDTQWQNGKPCQHSWYHCKAAYKKPSVICVV